jgi:3-deoxy-manno-octulosonate cytidylyltransferase (CMP-KDO synthetase)
MTDFRVVIPSRYASTRLPGKPLRQIGDALLVEHVYRASLKSGAREVIVATDDERVMAACEARDLRVMMTSNAHRSGTDRCAEVASSRGWGEHDIVVNVQGDEPLVPPSAIAKVAFELANASGGADLATLATPITCAADFHDANRVKVVCAADGRALYFSRAPIPFCRDPGDDADASWRAALHHIGLYAYRVKTLHALTALPPCELELTESLEQLRALYHGYRLQVGLLDHAPGPGVDTEDDLAAVERILHEHKS